MFTYIEVGEILKPFRTNGELLAVIKDRFKDDLVKAKAIFIETNGLKVPFFVEYNDSDGELLYIKFEEFSGPEEIKKYNGLKLFLRDTDLSNPLEQTEGDATADLSKYHILDINSNRSYKILRIEQYPQQQMAIIYKDNQEKLIPLVDELIMEINNEKKIITMALPINLV